MNQKQSKDTPAISTNIRHLISFLVWAVSSKKHDGLGTTTSIWTVIVRVSMIGD